MGLLLYSGSQSGNCDVARELSALRGVLLCYNPLTIFLPHLGKYRMQILRNVALAMGRLCVYS